jgi:soluble lytic murein transglycosylase-like protein
MKRLLHLLLVLTLALPAAARANTEFGPAPINRACRQAIAMSERAYGIPPHVLAAIARVESGRRDPATDTYAPWPWTINMDGQGSFYETKAEAVAAARAMRPKAARSIDVGCMQISLTFHPDAFASLEQAFDPVANVDYGARFLLQLYQKTNSWPAAVAAYHSATPDIGAEYRQRVYAALPAESQIVETGAASSLAAAWGATMRSPIHAVGMLQTVSPRIIPLQTAAVAGGVTAGRGLDAYRAAPVRFAYRAF